MGVRMRIPVSFLGRARLHTTCGNQQLGLRMCGLVCKSIPIRDFHFIQSWRKKLSSSYPCLMCKCIHTGQCEDVNAPPFWSYTLRIPHVYLYNYPGLGNQSYAPSAGGSDGAMRRLDDIRCSGRWCPPLALLGRGVMGCDSLFCVCIAPWHDTVIQGRLNWHLKKRSIASCSFYLSCMCLYTYARYSLAHRLVP